MRILVAEDDPMVSNVLESALRHEGFEVDLCSEDEVNERVSGGATPDIIVYDLGVMHELGVQLCHELLTQNPSCRLLPITSSVEQPSILKLPDGSAVSVMHKPFSLRVFLQEIKALAERCRERDFCGEKVEEAVRVLRHEMRNIAMIVSGSIEMLHEAAGSDPVLSDIVTRIERISACGLDSKTLQRLQETCGANYWGNAAFARSVARILRACEKGKAIFAEGIRRHCTDVQSVA